ncbi:Germ cell-less protein-like 1 [Microtus ochrogaster]|uniref:Germ cell-less protein-like 1 n=1 Tax=Microtus ochrogaster TaxID=79684 RepID=A0A8J6KV72_MICOH|nr:Germ cell-less protein-like 1 [Microtus ochrogaster]
MDIYTTLKEWLFLCLNPSWKGPVKEILVNANRWLSKHMERVDSISFLESEEGLIYQRVFKKLRFQHIICDVGDTATLERDRLIPLEWLAPIYKRQWLALLQEQEHMEIGPRIISEELEDCCMRCGTMIRRDGKYSWKWSDVRFSFPITVTFTNRHIIFRESRQQYDECWLKHVRHIVFKITLLHLIGKLEHRQDNWQVDPEVSEFAYSANYEGQPAPYTKQQHPLTSAARLHLAPKLKETQKSGIGSQELTSHQDKKPVGSSSLTFFWDCKCEPLCIWPQELYFGGTCRR